MDVLSTYGSQPLLDHSLGISDYWNCCRIILAYGLPIQQYMDDILRHLQTDSGGRTLRHYRAQHDHQVTCSQPILDRVFTPNSFAHDLAERLRVVLWERPFCPIRRDDSSAQFFGQFDYLSCATQLLDFLSYQNSWALGFKKHLQCLLDLVGIAFRYIWLACSQHLHVRFCAKQISGYLQFNGPGASGLEPFKSLSDIVRNRFDLRNRCVPVRNGLEHTQLVLSLVSR